MSELLTDRSLLAIMEPLCGACHEAVASLLVCERRIAHEITLNQTPYHTQSWGSTGVLESDVEL